MKWLKSRVLFARHSAPLRTRGSERAPRDLPPLGGVLRAVARSARLTRSGVRGDTVLEALAGEPMLRRAEPGALADPPSRRSSLSAMFSIAATSAFAASTAAFAAASASAARLPSSDRASRAAISAW